VGRAAGADAEVRGGEERGQGEGGGEVRRERLGTNSRSGALPRVANRG
jgi:hypothetical protein